MTFANAKDVPGREPASILELDLDFCTRSYGVSPCTAILALRNDLNYSQEFDQAAVGPTPGWSATVTPNAVNAPDGTLTADEFVRTVATPFQFESVQDRDIGLSLETLNTAQAYKMHVKPKLVGGVVSERYFGIGHFSSGTLAAYAWFDLETGASMGTGGSDTVFTHYIRYMHEAVEPGWYEVGFIFDSGVQPGTEQVGFFVTNSSFDVSTSGDIGDGVYIWGAQQRPVSPVGEASIYTGPFGYGKYAVRTTAVVDGMGAIDDLCFNTFFSCQDTANYNKAASPDGVDVDYEIVNVATSVDTPDSTYVDIAGYEIDQANLIDGDEYLLLVQTFMAHTASTSLNDNYVRMVDESGVEMTRSEYRYEASTTTPGLGVPYQYVQWFTANPTVGTGKLKMQAQQASGSGSVRTNGFRAFAINLTQLGAANYERARNTTPVTITGAGVWHVTETITLPSAGDWMIFTGVNDRGFNGGSDMPVRLRVDDTFNLIQADHDIEDSTGDKVHARWALFEGAAGGEDITSEQMTSGGVSWSADATVLIAIKLDAFAGHFVFSGNPIDPASVSPYDALADSFNVQNGGDYLWFSSLVSDWDTTFSGTQVINVDKNGDGAALVSGDHTYATDFGNVSEHNKQIFPNEPITLFKGDNIDVALEMVASATLSSVLTNGMVWGFAPNIASTDPDRRLRFIDQVERPANFLEYAPAIKKVSYTPTVLKPGGNLSLRGKVTVQLQDYATNDNLIDNYAQERTYNPEDQGTFFGKLKSRIPYYIGRPMRVLEGYLDNASVGDFRTREYIIDDISGPTATGIVTIVGKDILSLAADVRAKAPTASTGTLLAGITAVQTTATLAVGTGSQYANGDHISINDEIILINTIVADAITSMARGQGGTIGATANAGDAVQLCLTYDDEPIIDVINDLLQTYANVPPEFIPYTDWQAEEAASLSGYEMTTIIAKPTGVLTLLKELVEITLLDIWYDDVAQEIKLKLQTPFTEVTEEVNDQEDVLENSLVVKDLNAQRLTRVLIYYGILNFAKDLKEQANYSLANFEIEADKESVNKYDDERIKVIFSRWFDSSNAVQVALTSQRLLDRFGITPKAIQFKVDAKDVERLTTGDVFDLTSRIEQDLDGSPGTNRYQVTETKALMPASQYMYKCEAFFQDPTPDSLVIAAPETDYDVFVELGGPPGPVDVTLTINAAIRVSATNGNPAITTAGLHPDSTLRIVNNGEVYGYGGNAGNGGSANMFAENEEICTYFGNAGGGSAGQQGGDAIETTIDLTIDNTNGEIFGGGGGGGGGRGWASLGACSVSGGGGGGGGQGTDTGNLGGGGVATVTSCLGCGAQTADSGVNGTPGSVGAVGTGGIGGAVGSSGDGGDGGIWGVVGDAGATGAGGGAGGFAVRLNGNSIVWEGGNDAASVKGTVG